MTLTAFSQPTLTRRTRLVTLVLIAAVVVSSFLGRYDAEILGFRVRIEQVLPLVLTAWMLVHPVLRRSFLRAARHPVPVVFTAFIAWNLVSTLLFSPSLTWSVSILVWLLIDLLLLVSMMTLDVGAEFAGRWGRWSVTPWALIGFAAFAVANLSRGAFTLGTDFDWLYEVYVARLTAIEANIYASILVFWTLLAITRRGIGRWEVAGIAIAVPLGLVASQTRTSVFSLLLGLGVFAVFTLCAQRSSWRARIRRVAPAAVLAATLIVTYGITAALGNAQPADRTLPAPSSSSAPVESSPSADATTGASPAPEATRIPDPTDPEQQNKIGDVDLRGGTIGFRVTVAELAAQEMNGIHLWLGNGTNTFGLRHDQPGTPGVSGHIIMLPVQVLYDAGILGLALLVALFVMVFLKVPRERRAVAAGLLTAYLLSATLTSMFWFAVTWILFAVLLRPATEDDRDREHA
ncbi:O-antigen ligase family protein [Microbacterium sp. SLBN-111]|uniref:O-antigen ligase family protein n=1 Tax=Microbacterium sp. SLBN-111 TaxID=3377733 RepID=UPI003C71A4DE